MRVVVNNIASVPTRSAILPDIGKLGFSEPIRCRVVSIWENHDGISVSLWGDFAVTGDAIDAYFAWKRALVVEPPAPPERGSTDG
jgi:hypothetical protein